jgi:hypothetical protein
LKRNTEAQLSTETASEQGDEMTNAASGSQIDTTVVIGTTSEGRKVHMGWRRNGQLLCALTPHAAVIDMVVAELADDGGQAETIATLSEHRIAASRLCGHCFSIRLRRTYAAARKANARA